MARPMIVSWILVNSLGGLFVLIGIVAVGWRVKQSLNFAKLRARGPAAAEAMRQDLIKRWAKSDSHSAWYIAIVALFSGV